MSFEEWVRRAELAEAAGKAAWFRAVPEELATDLGLRVYRVGGASVWLTRGIDHYFANGVAALGVMQLAARLGRRDRGAVPRGRPALRHRSQPCCPTSPPAALAAGAWPDHDRARRALLARVGRHLARPRDKLTTIARGVRCWRTVDDPPIVASDLHIRVIGPRDAARFALLTMAEFTDGQPLTPGLAALVGRPEWRHYLAFDGDTAVAAAALFVHEGTAWLGWAYTLPAYRGRGMQSALLARRIADAGALGCTLVVADMTEDTPERPNPSYRNMLRLGFEHAYTKLIYQTPRA